MLPVRVYLSRGHVIDTDMNGPESEIQAYYAPGTVLNVGSDRDDLQQVVRVDVGPGVFGPLSEIAQGAMAAVAAGHGKQGGATFMIKKSATGEGLVDIYDDSRDEIIARAMRPELATLLVNFLEAAFASSPEEDETDDDARANGPWQRANPRA